MPAVFPGNTTPCNDWTINANELNTALDNAEILSQGNLTLTRIDGSTTVNSIPYFVDFIISGIALSQEPVPNLNEINYTGGTYQINAQQYTLALPGVIVCNASDPVFDRIDLIYLDTLGAINYLPGLAVLNPVVPTLPPNCLKVAEIGVEAGATGSSGYTLTSININNVITSAGFIEGQTLRWNSVSGKWVPTGNLNVSNAGQVGIGTFPTGNARLELNGAMELNPIVAPFPTTDKLYNIGGTLYWDGVAIGTANIVPGTAVGNTLYWDGTQWNESDEFKRVSGTFSEPYYNYNTTDGTGVLVDFQIGESNATGARGYQVRIVDTLNTTNLSNFVSLNGTNGATEYLLIQNDFTNDLRSLFSIDTFLMKTELGLLSDALNGNFSEDTSTHWYKKIGSNITNTSGIYTDIRQDENTYSVEVNNGTTNNNTFFNQGLTNFTFTKSDSTGVDTEFVAGQVPVAGENGFQFRVNDSLGGNDLYCLMTAQDSVNNKTTFKVNQLDSTNSDFSSLELSSKVNQFNLLDGPTGTFLETIQTLSNGVVNRAVSTTADSFVKVTPAQINLDSYNAVTPTTYTSLIQTSTGFQLYSNNSNTNLISNVITSNGKITLNGGIVKRYRNTAINTAIVENDWMIVSTASLIVTLPAAPEDGRELVFRSVTGTMTINGNGKNIEAAPTQTVTVGNSRTLIFNATLNRWLNI